MNEDGLKLTTYFGERDRVGGRFLADALLDVYERHELLMSVLLRGAEGFGAKQKLRTQRLLTLSEDESLVSVALDTRERTERAADEVSELCPAELVTLEEARVLSGRVEPVALGAEPEEATKLTVYCGRHARAAGRPAHVAVVDLLHRRGIAGATVLLGVDGTVQGTRQRADFFGRNAEVPLLIVAVGSGERIAPVLPELAELLPNPVLTLEPVRVCKRDGRRLAEPRLLPAGEASGPPMSQKLTIYASEQARHAGRPAYLELVRQLRAAGAEGATVLRGVWGYHGEHPPHGDRLLALRRRVPVVTSILDRPERMSRWFELVDQLMTEGELVTSEEVRSLRSKAF